MTFDRYEIEKDRVVPGRLLTRFPDGSCRETWPVEIQLQALADRVRELEAIVLALPSPVTQTVPAKINVNTADLATLETVTGIGEVTASRIIAVRQEAPFVSLEDFRVRAEISGPNTTKILDQVEV